MIIMYGKYQFTFLFYSFIQLMKYYLSDIDGNILHMHQIVNKCNNRAATPKINNVIGK